MKKFFENILNLYARERRGFFWISVVFFLVFLVMAVFRSYVDTVFLKRYGADSIPVMLLINGVVTVALFGVLERLGKKYTDHILLSGFLVLSSFVIAALFLPVQSGSLIPYPLLFQILNIQDSVFLVYLWNIACDLFDARQGRRIFPLIMAAQVLGTTVGSFSAAPFAAYAGYDQILVVTSAAYFLIAAGIFLTAPGMPGSTGSKRKEVGSTAKGPSEILALARKFPIIRYLIVCGLAPNILLPIFTYQFSVIAQHSFTGEHELLTFLSIFRGSATVISFFLLFAMGRVYARTGIPNASLIQPFNFALLFSLLMPFFNIYAAAYGQFSSIFIQRSVAGPLNKVLFNLIPDAVSAWSRIFIRGTVIRAAIIAGALLMVLLKPVVSPRGLAPLAVAIAAYWIWETLIFRARYAEGLKQILTEDTVDYERIEADFPVEHDVTSMVYQAGSLARDRRSDTPFLSRHEDALSNTALMHIAGKDDSFRADAAAFFGKSRDPRAVNRLIACLDDSETVRKAAIESLSNYGEEVRPFFEAALPESNSRVQSGILNAMHLSGLSNFDLIPFISGLCLEAYQNLMILEALKKERQSHSYTLLSRHLQERNDEILNMIFYALRVSYSDMRLLYRALQTNRASTAIEMVQETVDRDVSKYILPLIDEIPVEEKIRIARTVLPLSQSEDVQYFFPKLSKSRDSVTRMLVAYSAGEHDPDMKWYPVVENLVNDTDEGVRQAAAYAVKRCMKGEANMPEIIFEIDVMKKESLFDNISISGYKAIASIAAQKFFKSGDVLIREGEDVPSLFIIVDGSVNVIAGHNTSSPRLLRTIGEGDVIGEIYLFSQQPAAESFVTASDFLEVRVFSRHAFYEIMSIHPQIGMNLCRQFAGRLLESEKMRRDASARRNDGEEKIKIGFNPPFP